MTSQHLDAFSQTKKRLLSKIQGLAGPTPHLCLLRFSSVSVAHSNQTTQSEDIPGEAKTIFNILVLSALLGQQP